MKAAIKKIEKKYNISNTSILIVSFLMLSFIGATLYVMYQGL
ncbi:hypothetical protein [Panacibacter ginsenosidivorans]|nr:hypothetical protein [Panacibacter ginsenosidivorans]